MATPAYAQLTHGLRVPYAKKHYHFNEGGLKKNMPFILLLIIIEIAFIHVRLTQLTRKHTPQFCLRILTRLKVLLTQPFDMSNPFCKQSTGVLNAAHLFAYGNTSVCLLAVEDPMLDDGQNTLRLYTTYISTGQLRSQVRIITWRHGGGQD